MNDLTKKELILNSYADRPFLVDFNFKETRQKKPVILFVHGFKGFKDWGFFNLMSDWFAENSFFFIKLNFSHNGTTINHPTDFDDLEAFGNNNFSKELLDLETLLDHLFSKENEAFYQEADTNNMTLLGHSKGGATAIIKAYEDLRIRRVATLASVLDIKTRYAEKELTSWKSNGVIYIPNSRTNQEMPVYYQLAEDVLVNEQRFDISSILKKIDKKTLLIHPKQDETVPLEELTIAKNINNNTLDIKEINGNHTFDGAHPYMDFTLPQSVQTAVELIKAFIDNDTH